MNHECFGDVFERWGKTWGRCLGDGSFFAYEIGIEFCPNCDRPWMGVSVEEKDPNKRHTYDPDEDKEVLLKIDLPHFKRLAEERERMIAHLEEKHFLWQKMYYDSKGMELGPPEPAHRSKQK